MRQGLAGRRPTGGWLARKPRSLREELGVGRVDHAVLVGVGRGEIAGLARGRPHRPGEELGVVAVDGAVAVDVAGDEHV